MCLSSSPTNSLSEVGKLELPKVLGKYETGQLFLHRIFGYRGVILFPWLAQVYDRDLPGIGAAKTAAAAAAAAASKNIENDSTKGDAVIAATEKAGSRVAGATDDEETDERPEVKGKTNTFYQVLIDSRDCPYIVSIGRIG